MIRNILIPVDFSDCSKNALKIAIKIAKAYNAKIHLLNAVHVHANHPDLVGGSIVESVIMDYEEHVKKSFGELETEIFELKDVPHEAERFLSYLTDAVYTETKRKSIDLIVMGTRSEHSGFEQMFGSRATDVMRSATVPVMVIPEGHTEFKLNKIGLAVDLNEIKNYQNLDFLSSLGILFGSEILAFSIVKNLDKITLKEQRVMEEIRKRLSACNCSVRTILASSISKGIAEFTAAHQLDMLAITPKEHSFLHFIFKRSITLQVAMEIKIPMLSFRE